MKTPPQPHFTKDWRTRAIHIKLPVHLKEEFDAVTRDNKYLTKTGVVAHLIEQWLSARNTGQKFIRIP